MEADTKRGAEQDELADAPTEETSTPQIKLVVLAVLSAVAVALFFQAKTIAYNNYGPWDLRFCALELAVGLASACLVRAGDLARGRGERWAARYVEPGSGWLWDVLSTIAPAALCATVMTLLLSVANVLVVAQVFYRETVAMPPLAIIARFLADLPHAFLLCLLVRLGMIAVERRASQRQKAAASEA